MLRSAGEREALEGTKTKEKPNKWQARDKTALSDCIACLKLAPRLHQKSSWQLCSSSRMSTRMSAATLAAPAAETASWRWPLVVLLSCRWVFSFFLRVVRVGSVDRLLRTRRNAETQTHTRTQTGDATHADADVDAAAVHRKWAIRCISKATTNQCECKLSLSRSHSLALCVANCSKELPKNVNCRSPSPLTSCSALVNETKQTYVCMSVASFSNECRNELQLSFPFRSSALWTKVENKTKHTQLQKRIPKVMSCSCHSLSLPLSLGSTVQL